MRIRHRIAYDKDTVSKDFICFLEDRHATIDDDGTDTIVAYIDEEEECKSGLLRYLAKEEVVAFIDLIFTKKEMDESEWYAVQSTFIWEYPQPEESYMEWTYDSYCSNCCNGSRQKDYFRVKKEPKWGQRNFLMLNWIEDELFISDRIVNILKTNELRGYRILDVHQSKKEVPMQHIKQLCVETILPPGLVNLEESIETTLRCRECGSVKYLATGRQFTFNKDVFRDVNVDIIKSTEVFGDGFICARLILISKKFYKVLRDNKLDRGLEIQPIKLV